MPTGFTSFIENGTITTGKDFLLLCSRNFGLAAEISRDKGLKTPIPTHFTPDNFYQKHYEESVEKYKKFSQMTDTEFAKYVRTEYDSCIDRAKQCLNEMIAKDKVYQRIKQEVEKWKPPTDLHENIKTFALNQIDMCISTDHDYDYYMRIINKTFEDTPESVKKYKKNFLKSLKDEIRQAKSDLNREIKRVEDYNIFMKQFLESLETIKV